MKNPAKPLPSKHGIQDALQVADKFRVFIAFVFVFPLEIMSMRLRNFLFCTD
ncbi:protein of unknown function [Maridesulfovibrio hydrothermalis AM13 = DSM 14728]|uniref:Uncharacterized protein n=1 Tax=Maridesulfovibrio hydrothermalis AM13 = DSM 14728 TaxID=1121451 RepID=L0RAV5_9BACT|nr:protein of unknown function [Maridesulfovibrio hydrothermalis AM13 = DSM 14728]